MQQGKQPFMNFFIRKIYQVVDAQVLHKREDQSQLPKPLCHRCEAHVIQQSLEQMTAEVSTPLYLNTILDISPLCDAGF